MSKRHNHIGQWPVWREEALALIQDRAEKAQREKKPMRKPALGGQKRRTWEPREDGSTLVEVFMWEGDSEAAWREAQAYGCADTLWLVLAKRREKEHPEDAVPIYQQEVEELLRYADNARYGEAVKALRKVGRLMVRMGKRDKFRSYLAEVRTKNRRRPNLMKLMDKTRWP